MKKYIVEQKITAFVNRYAVYDTDSNGDKSNLVAFAEQKRFAFKEEVTFFADEAKSTSVFGVKAEKVMDIHGKFIVTDSTGKKLGAVRKAFKSSLLRSTWEILDDNDNPKIVLRETSQNIAILRRIWNLLPYLNDIPFFIKYHFEFIKPDDGTVVANYIKTTRLRDHYELQIEDEGLLETVGWQTLIAQAVLLDALQGR